MANPLWPASLPQKPLMSGFSETMPNLVVRSQTDTGPAKMRIRSTAMASPIIGRMLMTGTQIGLLETFGRSTLVEWTSVFDFTDPVTRTTIQARFVEVPSWTHVSGNYFSVQLSLEEVP